MSDRYEHCFPRKGDLSLTIQRFKTW